MRDLYEILPAQEWKSGENQTNKIAFIGKPFTILRTSFR